ncbi:unnamed protein product [Cylindrotheca closterium]|uniref:Kinesin light chain n=1 Tax=Cylindrotheca closterium TaxID=2856 RepID=A0AAD2CEJ7_9STRA|nr:unnamed protein product [Cylindrotheca closterium]
MILKTITIADDGGVYDISNDKEFDRLLASFKNKTVPYLVNAETKRRVLGYASLSDGGTYTAKVSRQNLDTTTMDALTNEDVEPKPPNAPPSGALLPANPETMNQAEGQADPTNARNGSNNDDDDDDDNADAKANAKRPKEERTDGGNQTKRKKKQKTTNKGEIINISSDSDAAKEIKYNGTTKHQLDECEKEKQLSQARKFMDDGNDLKKKRRYVEAIHLFQEALEIRLDELGFRHVDTARSYNSIGDALREQLKYDEALRHYRKALDIRLKVLGNRHADTAESYYKIGVLFEGKSGGDEMLESHQKALDIRLNVLGNRHVDTAQSYSKVGSVFYHGGLYDEALKNHQKALDIRLEVLGNSHGDVAEAYRDVGCAYDGQGKYKEATNSYRQAIEIDLNIPERRQTLDCIDTYYYLGKVLAKQNKDAESRAVYQQALDIVLEEHGEDEGYAVYLRKLAKGLYVTRRPTLT